MNGTKFISRFLATLFTHLGTNQLTASNRLSLPNQCAVETTQQSILTRLRHYMANSKHGWDFVFQPLIYPHKTQEHLSTNTTSFCLVLLCNTTGPATFDDPFAFSSVTYYPTEIKCLQANLRTRVSTLSAQASTRPPLTQRWYEQDNDKDVREPLHSQQNKSFTSTNHGWAPLQW